MRLAQVQLPFTATAVAGASLIAISATAGSAEVIEGGAATANGRASSGNTEPILTGRSAASGSSRAERGERLAALGGQREAPAASGSSRADRDERVAAASGLSRAAERERARAIYEQGKRAYRAGRFRAAIAHFTAADKQAPSAALSFNVARAYEKLEEPARALQHYRNYLRRGPARTNADEVERRVAQLEAALAEQGIQQLTVRSEPGGATLFVDGKARGSTPWTGELPLGTHELAVERDGYAARHITVHLSDGAKDVQLELAPLPPHRLPSNDDSARAPASGARSAASQPWPWVSVGVGGAALAGAGLFELLRRDAESDAKRARFQPAYHEHRERMERQQTTARVLLGTGALLVLGGGVWMLVDASVADDLERSPVVFDCQPGACLGAWKGTF